MSGQPPTCLHGHPLERVGEEYAQATRSEPPRLLGIWGYCPTCDVSIRLDAPPAHPSLASLMPGWDVCHVHGDAS